MTKARKKLIEVSLPLDAINKEALRRKQKAPKGWPTSFHKWWAQRPLASARAVLFSQLIDDPSDLLEEFPTPEQQDEERKRLFAILRDLVLWDNSHDARVVQNARHEILKSWRRTCSDNRDHAPDSELYDSESLPDFCDPFTGSGSLPLSAQWLGMRAYASDLNPVAVLINKGTLELPAIFSGRTPVRPDGGGAAALVGRDWNRAQGLAEDVRYYTEWMRTEAMRRIGHLHPSIRVEDVEAQRRPGLQELVGQELTCIAYLWARTVKSPNPAFAQVDVPLVTTFMLSTRKGKEAYVRPVVEGETYRFEVEDGAPEDRAAVGHGTKLGGSGSPFLCLMSGTPMPFDYLRAEAKAGRMGVRLLAVVAESPKRRVYLSPTEKHQQLALAVEPGVRPETELPEKALGFRVQEYGMVKWRDFFTERQLVSLGVFADLVAESRSVVRAHAIDAGVSDDGVRLENGGTGASAYAEAVSVYLACVVDRMAYYGSRLSSWLPKDNALRDCMPRQAFAMTWDFAEANPFGKSSGDVRTCSRSVTNYLDAATPHASAYVQQCAAQQRPDDGRRLIFSTDPPYFDNIGYADLSDFFYFWLRQSLRDVYPQLFATVGVPKAEELVANPHRHSTKQNAETFFLAGMSQAMSRIAEQSHPAFPVTIYYAFKQSEQVGDAGVTRTGWETFLDAVIGAGFRITGTWPMRTEGSGRMRASGSNALASSIVLVCRVRDGGAPTATRREFVRSLKNALPEALAHLQRGGIAPVDLAQAAIGPGMAVFTGFGQVIDAEGTPLSVRGALALINETLEETLAEQEGDFDADSRWALAWFEQCGFDVGEYGLAEQLSKSKVTSVAGLVEAGLVASKGGRVRLLRPKELPADWDPTTDSRLTVWEMVHHLVRVLESEGESSASDLAARLGTHSEAALEMSYLLYSICERKKWAEEARSYNGLVVAWPELERIATGSDPGAPDQQQLF